MSIWLLFHKFLGLIQAIDAFRSKLQPVLSEALSESETAFPREWLQQGRQTPPRLMVYFGTPPKGRQAQGMNLVGWTLDLDFISKPSEDWCCQCHESQTKGIKELF